MKIEKFQLRGNNSVCTGAFRLLRGRATAHFRRSTDLGPIPVINNEMRVKLISLSCN
jgi:hypothetical protein